MDFQGFVDSVGTACCVMSVEKTADGAYGDIRIVCANEQYKKVMGPSYYDGMPYNELVPQDNKFEDYCYRAAVLKQHMHAYVETRALGCWTDQNMIPLESDRGDMGYCQYIFEFTDGAEADRMTSVSVAVADIVLKVGMTITRGERFRESLDKVLDIIMEASGAKGCRIVIIDSAKKEAVNYCEKIVDGYWHINADEGDVITYDLVEQWEALLGVSDSIIIKDENDMEAVAEVDPLWAESMKEHGVTSLVLIPLHRDKKVVGYLYVVNFNVDKVVEVKESLELISYILGTEISNHQLVKRLDEISQIDMLTGIGNRRAMKRKMDQIRKSEGLKPFGIVNIDLNGLKTVNDHYGHEAGDRMLIQSGEILQKVFYQDDLFRTGGDEFVVIMSDIDEEAFDRKVSRLKTDVDKDSEVSFAIGTFWSDGSTSLTQAFKIADDRMYQDKQAYYDAHPDKQRR